MAKTKKAVRKPVKIEAKAKVKSKAKPKTKSRKKASVKPRIKPEAHFAELLDNVERISSGESKVIAEPEVVVFPVSELIAVSTPEPVHRPWWRTRWILIRAFFGLLGGIGFISAMNWIVEWLRPNG